MGEEGGAGKGRGRSAARPPGRGFLWGGASAGAEPPRWAELRRSGLTRPLAPRDSKPCRGPLAVQSRLRTCRPLPWSLSARRTPSERLLVAADVRLPLSPPQCGSGRVLGLRLRVGRGHGAALGGAERGVGACAAAPGVHGAVGRSRGPGTGLRGGAGSRAAPAGTPGPGLAARAGRLPAAQPPGQRGALPARGSQHPGRDAGRPRCGPGLGVLLPVPEPGAAAQRALRSLSHLHPASGPPLPPAGPLRGLPQLPALPVPAAPRRRRPAPRLGAAGPGPLSAAASPHPPPRCCPPPAALAHAAHRQSVPGAVRLGLRDGHVRGGGAAVWGRAALPRDAAAAGPDHVGVGSGPAPLRPGPPPQPAGGPGAPLGPRLALALPGLPLAWGRDHLPDHSRGGTRGFLTSGRAGIVRGRETGTLEGRRGGPGCPWLLRKWFKLVPPASLTWKIGTHLSIPAPSLAMPLPSLDSYASGAWACRSASPGSPQGRWQGQAWAARPAWLPLRQVNKWPPGSCPPLSLLSFWSLPLLPRLPILVLWLSGLGTRACVWA